MMVESYLNQELNNVIFDIDSQDEWKEIASFLGLKNQLSFTENAKSPLPYPYMNQSMKNIFSTLCPASVDLKDYDKTPIPLEVMREIKFCVEEKYFDRIKIWYDDKEPDPFVVGIKELYQAYYKDAKGERQSTGYIYNTREQAQSFADSVGGNDISVYSQSSEYLIARWGDELCPFEELKQRAQDRLIEKYTTQWELSLSDLKNKIENSKQFINKFINAEISEWDLKAIN